MKRLVVPFVLLMLAGCAKSAVISTNAAAQRQQAVPVVGQTGGSAANARTEGPAASGQTLYRLSGDGSLWPTAMSDDGKRIQIVWAEDQSLPAVFAISQSGQEEMVDGYMRNGIFEIDRLYPVVVFRIDKTVARAERIAADGARNGQ